MNNKVTQNDVSDWLDKTFPESLVDNPRQRMQRFLEEDLEWFQSEDITKQDAIALVDYVYGRDKGEPEQEIGGVGVTLFAACSRMGYDFNYCLSKEFDRINRPEVIDKIRKKQDTKNNTLGISDIS